MGTLAGQSTQGNDNVFIGTEAGRTITVGSQNTLVGSRAGWWSGNVAGVSGNVFIGFNAGYTETGSDKLYIANSATPYPLIHGDFSASQLTVYGTLIAASAALPSDERLKTDIRKIDGALDRINRIEGVTYMWKTEAVRRKGFPRDRQTGLLAQNVETVLPDAVYRDREGYRAVSYEKLVPLLVEAVKEQKKIIEEMRREMAAMKTARNQ